MQRLKTIKGTHDILPGDIHRWQQIETVLRRVFEVYAYREIRTPVFENTALFARGVGEFSDIVSKEMYTFTDKGGESLTLRPELTASVARSFIQHHFQQDAPLHKLWYMGPLFRQERPQAGRQRQFHQFGIEVIGSPYPEADAEVITVACRIYRELGLKHWELQINSIGSPDTRKHYIEILKKTLDPYKKDLCDTCRERFEGNILRLFDCKNPECAEVMQTKAPSILDHLSDEDSRHFEEVKALLSALQIEFTINPALVRGLDYYTRTTFEIKGTALGAQDALCGGGRYDGLISDLDGPETPAVGFAAGMERLVIAMEAEHLFDQQEKSIDLYIAPMNKDHLLAVMPLINRLREKGFIVHAELLRRSVKAMLRDANRQNTRWTAVVGDLELEKKELNLKNMRDNTQQTLSWEKVENVLTQNPE
jgi:histidyl-tRNA synthetase